MFPPLNQVLVVKVGKGRGSMIDMWPNLVSLFEGAKGNRTTKELCIT